MTIKKKRREYLIKSYNILLFFENYLSWMNPKSLFSKPYISITTFLRNKIKAYIQDLHIK